MTFSPISSTSERSRAHNALVIERAKEGFEPAPIAGLLNQPHSLCGIGELPERSAGGRSFELPNWSTVQRQANTGCSKSTTRVSRPPRATSWSW